MKYEVEITKDNCEGYIELYQNYNFNKEENKEIGKATIKAFSLLSIGLIILPIAGASANVIALASIPALGAVMGTFLKKCHDVNNRKMRYLEGKHPNIDVHVSYYELERALERANILKFTNNNKTEYTVDLYNYYKYHECEQIKNDLFTELKYQQIVVEPVISEKELEKVKTKVKTIRRWY